MCVDNLFSLVLNLLACEHLIQIEHYTTLWLYRKIAKKKNWIQGRCLVRPSDNRVCICSNEFVRTTDSNVDRIINLHSHLIVIWSTPFIPRLLYIEISTTLPTTKRSTGHKHRTSAQRKKTNEWKSGRFSFQSNRCQPWLTSHYGRRGRACITIKHERRRVTVTEAVTWVHISHRHATTGETGPFWATVSSLILIIWLS